ncbi:MAG: hypothetical protein RMY36_010055 [Nostoc sp. SerVER01]|nr:hypothetical protein [Nostoc sp. DedQUE11]MDZ8081995.1 hypothetical protein [Nostoc sp. DcaGUA01]
MKLILYYTSATTSFGVQPKYRRIPQKREELVKEKRSLFDQLSPSISFNKYK